MTRSATSWFSRNEPDCQSIASTSVVFPWSTCATIATLRISPPLLLSSSPLPSPPSPRLLLTSPPPLRLPTAPFPPHPLPRPSLRLVTSNSTSPPPPGLQLHLLLSRGRPPPSPPRPLPPPLMIPHLDFPSSLSLLLRGFRCYDQRRHLHNHAPPWPQSWSPLATPRCGARPSWVAASGSDRRWASRVSGSRDSRRARHGSGARRLLSLRS